MKKNILKTAKSIHFIGIGGIGVSGLAKILLEQGKIVSGSDNEESALIKKLRDKGTKIFIGQKEKNVSRNTEIVVYSQAIPPDNQEYKKACELGIPLLSYPEALGMLMEDKKGIAIAGTHGKTTSSALIVTVFQSNGLSPSFVIGGEIVGKGNSGAGKSNFLVVEACEYKESFLHYAPETAVITNIDRDHLDYYRSIREIKNSFRKFCSNIKKDGCLISYAEDKNLKNILQNNKELKDKRIQIVRFGFGSGDFRAKNISFSKGFTFFDCFKKSKLMGRVKLRAYGLHNVCNSLGAIAVADRYGIDWNGLTGALARFKGVRRRCEMKGQIGNILVMDDYAHHPTEIKATLCSLKEIYPGRRLVVIFQPHQYSRTRFLLKDFAASFECADKVIVPDIFFVRDSQREKELVNAAMLVKKIRNNGKEAMYLPTFDEIVSYLEEIVKQGDLLLTMGAGPVYQVGEKLLANLKRL